MRAGLITIFVLAMAGGLSGCGQKGPLYQDVPATTGAAEESVAEQSASDSEEDRPR
jgi:predicted small lipoprotein YifL